MFARSRRARRFLVHMLNMALGMAIFLATTSFVGALVRGVENAVGRLGTNVVVVADRARAFVPGAAEGVELTWSSFEALRAAFGTTYEVSAVRQTFAMVGDGVHHPVYSNLWATSASFFNLMQLAAGEGRTLREDDNRRALPVCVVGRDAALAGVAAPLGGTLLMDSHRCRVVGRLREATVAPAYSVARAVFLPLEALPAAGEHSRTPITQVYLRARDGSLDPDIAARIRGELARAHDLSRIEVWSAEEFWRARRLIVSHLSALVLGVAAVIVALAAFGLASGLHQDVAARRPEIGLRIALGATRRQIFSMIIAEGALIVGAGGAAGIAAGAALIALVIHPLSRGAEFYSATLDIGVSPLALALSFATLLLAALAASYLPARSAALTEPSLALRGMS